DALPILAIPPTSRPPMALGCPVREQVPDPGFPVFPVIGLRLISAKFLFTPSLLWFSPIAHKVKKPLALPVRVAACLISSEGIPHRFAASDRLVCITLSL